MAFRGGIDALLFLTFLTYASCQEITLDMGIKPGKNVHLGEDFKLECRVGNYAHADPGLIVNWWKRQDNETVQLGENHYPEKTLEDANRYTGSYRRESPHVTYIIDVAGAADSDTGEFGCSIREMDDVSAFREVNVFVPVESVRLFEMKSDLPDTTPMAEYKDGQVVQLTEGEPYYFRCVVSGSNPQPTVTVTSGDTNITGLFTSEVRRRVLGTTPGFRRVSYITVLTMSFPLMASWDHNGKNIRCTANVDYTQSVAIYITPELNFKPHLECPAVMLVELHQTDVQLTCTVRSHPEVEHAVWSWATADGESVFLGVGEDNGHYKATVEAETGVSDGKLVALRMDRIFPQMFRSYYVEVRSSAGKAMAEIQLADKNGDNDEYQIVASSTINLPPAIVITLIFISTYLC